MAHEDFPAKALPMAPGFLFPVFALPAPSDPLTTVSKIDPIRLYFPISEKSYKDHADALREMMQKRDSELFQGSENGFEVVKKRPVASDDVWNFFTEAQLAELPAI